MITHTRSTSKGVTLMEMMIVIGIIGILASIVAYATIGVRERADLADARIELEQWEAPIANYYIDNAAYPADGPADVPSELRSYFPSVPQSGTISGPWPNSYLDYDYWQPGVAGAVVTEDTVQMSIRFCDFSGDCTIPNTEWASNFSDINNSIFWCFKGDCRANGNSAKDTPGYCINCECKQMEDCH